MDYDKKEGVNYLDGVPIRISSKFCPPRPVTLPFAFIAELPYDLLAEKYDFSLERQVLESDERRKVEQEAAKVNAVIGSISTNADSISNISFQENLNMDNVIASLAPNNQNILPWKSDKILQPQSQQSHSRIVNDDKTVENSKKINLSDFENDTSTPFDYMELQTINDLEELNSVFQGLHTNKMPSDENVHNEVRENLTFEDSNSIPKNEVPSNVSKSISFPLTQNDDLNYPEKTDTYKLGNKVSSLAAGLPSANNSRLSISYPSISNFIPDCKTFPNKLHLENDHIEIKNYSALSQVPYISSHSARHSITGESDTETNSLKTTLRSSKSYSDLYILSEDETAKLKKERPCTPTIKLSSSQSTNTSVKELSDNDAHSQVVFNDKINNGIVTIQNSEFYLPDPYDELDTNAKHVVDSIVDMGFSRAQVARTVKHLGMDDKKIIEHLCQIQILEESGYDSLEAEAALHLHDYNKEQAKIFLDLVYKFQDLGFEKNAVKKALVQNKNDWNKTIDALLSNNIP